MLKRKIQVVLEIVVKDDLTNDERDAIIDMGMNADDMPQLEDRHAAEIAGLFEQYQIVHDLNKSVSTISDVEFENIRVIDAVWKS